MSLKRHGITSAGMLALVGIIAGAIVFFGKGLFRGSGPAAAPAYTPAEIYPAGVSPWYEPSVAKTREEAMRLGVPWYDFNEGRWIYPQEVSMAELPELKLESGVPAVTVPQPDVTGVTGLAAAEKLRQFQEEISFGHYEPTPENIAAVTAIQHAYLEQVVADPNALSEIWTAEILGRFGGRMPTRAELEQMFPNATFAGMYA